jgi:hypothetical protein
MMLYVQLMILLNLGTLFMLNLFTFFFLMLLVDALLVLNALIHWSCFSPFTLYSELCVQFNTFLKFIPGWKYSQNPNILSF